MISRRLLRVKALQILYAYRATENPSINRAEKELIFSIEKSYDLYHLIFLLLTDLTLYGRQRMEIARSKFFPTEEEANPNARFLDNRLIAQIEESKSFRQYIESRKLSWTNQEELIKSLYRSILEWDVYQDYMIKEEDSFEQDKKFIARLIGELILPDESFMQVLEEQSIYWNDDIEAIGSMVLKTLSKWKESTGLHLLSMYSNEDDRLFVINLFRKCILHSDEYQELIKRFSENWDFERLAWMDILIMQMAITEAIHFPSIPTKVSLNEYIEISKYYSTEKSSHFINGILDKIFIQLKTDNKIQKTGRGLIGEI
ncbi:MAG: transcription antitermination factor NusB [Bacteroidetes bacterium GWF2_49_14]|nr:MAG: transcription antitermination factor NusB [Bacteroidetes bacterium GWF2_49_14]HBB93609.1 transcription antitermination factor NusB [Bacteroidales bacterium]